MANPGMPMRELHCWVTYFRCIGISIANRNQQKTPIDYIHYTSLYSDYTHYIIENQCIKVVARSRLSIALVHASKSALLHAQMQNDKPPIVLTKSGHSGVQTSCSNTPQSANNVPESAETHGFLLHEMLERCECDHMWSLYTVIYQNDIFVRWHLKCDKLQLKLLRLNKPLGCEARKTSKLGSLSRQQ